MPLAYLLVFLLRHLIFSDMTLHKNSYYNVLVSRYGDDDGEVVEFKWMVSVDAFSSWLKTIDLQCCEVTIRDIEVIGFDSVITPPRWFKYGD